MFRWPSAGEDIGDKRSKGVEHDQSTRGFGGFGLGVGKDMYGNACVPKNLKKETPLA